MTIVKLLFFASVVMHDRGSYVGAEACQSCHQEKHAVWSQSTHGRAGSFGAPTSHLLPSPKTQVLQFKDAKVTFLYDTAKQQAKFHVKRPGYEHTFQVYATVGGGHMFGGGTQTYFVKYPDGTLRFLPFDFIRAEQTWFCEVRGREGWVPITPDLSLDRCLNWPPTRQLGGHNAFASSCGHCHGSQIDSEFDPKTKKFTTHVKDFRINCESCHGPGADHVKEMKQNPKSATAKIASLKNMTKDESVKLCVKCHGLKKSLRSDARFQMVDFEDGYSYKIDDLNNPLHPDGRIKKFAYQKNHFYSDCYINGSMTCLDCHAPHSNDYQDIFGKKLVGRFDNGQCTSCHPSKGHDLVEHTHHKPESKGSLCTSCHMPFYQHQAFGKKLRFARSDHTIAIPRPKFDFKLGLTNACTQCHRNIILKKLLDTYKTWWGEIKPHNKLVEALLQPVPKSRSEAAKLLLPIDGNHVMAQIRGLQVFAEEHLTPDMADLESHIVERLRSIGQHADPDLQATARAVLYLAKNELIPTNNSHVKRRWARLLEWFGGKYLRKRNWVAAETCFRKALKILPDGFDATMSLAKALAHQKKAKEALVLLDRLTAEYPDRHMPFREKGEVLLGLGQNKEAMTFFKAAADRFPWDSGLHVRYAQSLAHEVSKDKGVEYLANYRESMPLVMRTPQFEEMIKVEQNQLKALK